MAVNKVDQGRWMTPDPLGGDISNPQSLNRYAYALNNPATLTDPLGLDPSGCTAGTDDNGNPIVNCSGPDTVTVNGGEAPSLGLIMCQIGFGGCGQSSLTGPTSGYPQYGGGQGGTPPPKPAPPARALPQRLSCAAAFGAQNNFLVNLFLGNTASSLANLGLFVTGNAGLTTANLAGMMLKGAAQGIPVPPGNPGLSGAVGQLRSVAVQSAVSAGYNAIAGVGAEPIELGITAAGTVATPAAQLGSEALGTIAAGVGVAKLVYDAGAFGLGLIRGCQQ